MYNEGEKLEKVGRSCVNKLNKSHATNTLASSLGQIDLNTRHKAWPEPGRHLAPTDIGRGPVHAFARLICVSIWPLTSY